jgi:uncharacterized membrane protein YfcA
MDSLVVTIGFGAVIAGFVQGLSGFAFSMLAMSVWAWTIEPRLAASCAVFGGVIGQLMGVTTIRGAFEKDLLLPLFAGALAGIPLGVAILPHLDSDLFKTALGFILAICCPIVLLSGRLPRITAVGRTTNGLVGGVAGIMTGIGGFTGIFPTLWYTLRGFDKQRLRAMIQWFNLTTLTTTMALYVVTGITTSAMLPTFAIVAPAMLIPWWLGSRHYLGISEATYRNVVLGFLTFAGVGMVVSSLPTTIEHLY